MDSVEEVEAQEPVLQIAAAVAARAAMVQAAVRAETLIIKLQKRAHLQMAWY